MARFMEDVNTQPGIFFLFLNLVAVSKTEFNSRKFHLIITTTFEKKQKNKKTPIHYNSDVFDVVQTSGNSSNGDGDGNGNENATKQ